MQNDHAYEKFINPGFENFLLTRFDRMKHVTFDSDKYIVQKLKSTNAGMGIGGNPDFIVVAGNPAFFNIRNVQYHSFELKRSITGALQRGVGQASNYKLFSHYSYLACPVSVEERDSQNFKRLRTLCRMNNIGLISFLNSNFPDSYKMEISAPLNKRQEKDEDWLLSQNAIIKEHYSEIKDW